MSVKYLCSLHFYFFLQKSKQMLIVVITVHAALPIRTASQGVSFVLQPFEATFYV